MLTIPFYNHLQCIVCLKMQRCGIKIILNGKYLPQRDFFKLNFNGNPDVECREILFD